MHLNAVPLDPMNDGWNEPSERTIYADKQEVSIQCGDTVLYRKDGQLIPAVLMEPAGDGCWLARDARHFHSLIYLNPESVATRLPRIDLLGEAA